MNINDALFDFNKPSLKPGAREKLAKMAGILLAYPGLKIQLEGRADETGTGEYNPELSVQRAGAVRDYLAAQGLPTANLTATSLGTSSPAASGQEASGRPRNSGVEMVVSGERIGIEGAPPSAAGSPALDAQPRRAP